MKNTTMQKAICFGLFVLSLSGTACESLPQLPPGKSGAVILVRAEPKNGYTPPGSGGNNDYSTSSTSKEPKYELEDYDEMSTVVWLKRVGTGAFIKPAPITLKYTAPHQAYHPLQQGAAINFENASTGTLFLYARAEDGTVAGIGPVRPGQQKSIQISKTGYVQLMHETGGTEDALVAELFIAPCDYISTATSGKKVTFAPVSPGVYDMNVWHHRLPGSSQRTTLQPDQYGRVELVVSVNLLPSKSKK